MVAISDTRSRVIDGDKNLLHLFQTSAIATATILAASITITCFLLNRFNFPLNPDLLPTQISLLQLESTTYNKLSYVGYVAALAFLCIAIMIGWVNLERIAIQETYANLTILSLVPIFILSEWSVGNYAGFGMVAVILLLFPLAITTNDSDHPRWLKTLYVVVQSRPAMLLVLSSLILVMWVFPLGNPLTIDSLDSLTWVDTHYGVTVLSGYDLNDADTNYQMRYANYGLGIPLLTSAFLSVTSDLFNKRQKKLYFLDVDYALGSRIYAFEFG
jgi:hypothetical protein